MENELTQSCSNSDQMFANEELALEIISYGAFQTKCCCSKTHQCIDLSKGGFYCL